MRVRGLMLVSGCLLAACAEAAEPPASPKFKFAVKRPADVVTAAVEKDRVVFTVTSSEGVGAATIDLKEGEWPREVVIRFRYPDKRAFKTLEHFQLTTDRIIARGAMADSGKVPFSFRDAKRANDWDESGPNTAGTLKITVAKTDAGLELRLPLEMATGSKSLRAEWIDRYRY